MRTILYFYQNLNWQRFLLYRSRLLRNPVLVELKSFRRGLKLVKCCKTCKIYIADSEIIKKEIEKINARGSQSQKF